ncbi:hypothetical protein CK203_115316 [Vitis vinifera]|uniref:Uncharacterized protein n=1 Tax=Vitis vinifera TaxID=29760 RepID=A0A438CPE7_VITVI|nr:hypothetical protein CK203_115316 [Vitis vinifera]
MEFGALEVAFEAPKLLLAALEMALATELARISEMELELEPVMALEIAPSSFDGAGFTGRGAAFGCEGSETGSGTGSFHKLLLRFEGEEDLAPLVRAISGYQNLAGADGRRR